MATPNDTTGLKRCSRKENCIHPEAQDGWLPATVEYFYANTTAKCGLAKVCKECFKARASIYKKNHRARYNQLAREAHAKNPEIRRQKDRDWKNKDRKRYKEKRHQYYQENKDLILTKNREWFKAHPLETKQIKQRYSDKNKDKKAEYRKRNRQYFNEYNRRRYRAKIDIVKLQNQATKQRRKARQKNLPSTFTDREWQRALNYFNGCCAVCNKPMGLWHTLAADHWIPISKHGASVATNIVPLCHAQRDGTGGCNNSKSNQDAALWLTNQFGFKKAVQILKRIEAYFEWVRQQDGE
jgi:hypothetical protein